MSKSNQSNGAGGNSTPTQDETPEEILDQFLEFQEAFDQHQRRVDQDRAQFDQLIGEFVEPPANNLPFPTTGSSHQSLSGAAGYAGSGSGSSGYNGNGGGSSGYTWIGNGSGSNGYGSGSGSAGHTATESGSASGGYSSGCGTVGQTAAGSGNAAGGYGSGCGTAANTASGSAVCGYGSGNGPASFTGSGYGYDPAVPSMEPMLQYTPTPMTTTATGHAESVSSETIPKSSATTRSETVTSSRHRAARLAARPIGRSMQLPRNCPSGQTERKPCRPDKMKTPLKKTPVEAKGKEIDFSPASQIRYGGVNATPPRATTSPRFAPPASPFSPRRDIAALLGIRRLSTSREVLFPPNSNPEDKYGPSFDDPRLSSDAHGKVRLIITTDFEILANHHPRQVRQEVRCETRGGCNDPNAIANLVVSLSHSWKCKV